MSQRLNSFITSNKELSQISGKVRQLRAIQRHYEQISPATLLRSSQVIQLDNFVLTLGANNSAVAAKLRQMTPELIKQLQLHGCEVTGIQVRVQVTIPTTPTSNKTPVISPQGKQKILDLADKLSESPLKQALQRLIDKR